MTAELAFDQDHWPQFASFEKGLNGETRSYVHGIRRDAFEQFSRLGLPVSRLEEWKYSNAPLLGKISLQTRPKKVDVESTRQMLLQAGHNFDCVNQVVLVDGYYVPELSRLVELPKGAVVGSLAQAFNTHPACIKRHFAQHVGQKKALAALNTAFTIDGLFVYLPANSEIAEPIFVTNLSTGDVDPACRYARMLVVAEQDCRFKLIETHADTSQSAYLSNVVSEIVLGDRTIFDHVRLACQGQASLQVASTNVEQAQDSQYRAHSLTVGGAFLRHEMTIQLTGKGAQCQLFGLDLVKSDQHVDNCVNVEHLQPYCVSSQVYKGIYDERASGAFLGKILVLENAEKTDARQINRNLLLSKDACVNTRPQLEIYADDVKCSHGATVGQLDENALFYLRARGIDNNLAKNMLTKAFAQEILDTISVRSIRERLEQEVTHWMSSRRVAGRVE